MSFWGELYRRSERFGSRDTELESRQVLDALRYVTGEILDVGCGNGRHVDWLRSEGLAVRGVDFDPEAAGEAGDMRALPYDTARFGGAYSLRNTSVGFSDVELALVWGELARVLRPGGLLFVTTTSAAWSTQCLRKPVTGRSRGVTETAHFRDGRLTIRRALEGLAGEISVRLFTIAEWAPFLASHGFEASQVVDTGPTTRVTAMRALTSRAT